MNSAQRHRGPDGEGVWQEEGIALAHVRLAILDLSDAGHQPFLSDDQRYILTYNGEIYNYLELRKELQELNHCFNSDSDTEVLLHAYMQWGEDCLEKLNGMWAFAIWDCLEQKLFCARDHFGIKPFHYWSKDGQFIFASEIKALLAHPLVDARPDECSIHDYLLFSLVNHCERTFFEDIQQLAPAHCLSYQNGELKVRRWWQLQDQLPQGEGEAFDVGEALEKSVRLRMRSDVPVGACLSGGLDSTSIVSLMSNMQKGRSFKSFTSIYGDPQLDEDAYVELTAAMHPEIDSNITKLDSSDLWTQLCQLVKIQEEPFQSSSIFAQHALMQTAQAADYKVLMDGQGADECLAGYDIYLSTHALSGGLLQFPRRSRSIKAQRGIKSRSLLTQALHTRLYKYDWMPSIYALCGQAGSKILGKEFKKRQNFKSHWQSFSTNFLKDHMYQMLFHSNLPALLRYEDRNSMACSIETRLPFLDPDFVQGCFSLPADDYIRDGITKAPLRQAMQDKIPQKIATRKDKIGFATPEQKWFRELQPQIEAIFDSESFKSRPYFNHTQVKLLFKQYCLGKQLRKFPLWRVLNLELWLREYVD